MVARVMANHSVMGMASWYETRKGRCFETATSNSKSFFLLFYGHKLLTAYAIF